AGFVADLLQIRGVAAAEHLIRSAAAAENSNSQSVTSDGLGQFDTLMSIGSATFATRRTTSITPCHMPAKSWPTWLAALFDEKSRALAIQKRGSSSMPAAVNSDLTSLYTVSALCEWT